MSIEDDKLVELLAGYLVAQACMESSTGYYYFHKDELEETFGLEDSSLDAMDSELASEISHYSQVSDVDIDDTKIELYLDMSYYGLK